MRQPFFSIIIVVFNGVSTLSKAINSALYQSFKDIEVLVIDGGSTDGSVEIIKSFASADKRLNYVSEKDNGIYDAMNKGVKLASGRWLYFLGCDDMLADDEVLFDVADKTKNTKLNFVLADVLLMPSRKVYGGEFTFDRLVMQNISHQAIFYESTFFKQIGEYNLKYKTHADWEFNLRCFSNRSMVSLYYNRIVSYFYIGGASSFHDRVFLKEVLLKIHVNRIHSDTSLLKSVSYFDFVWRILRNAGIRNAEDKSSEQPWPFQLKVMIAIQQSVPLFFLKNGVISKLCMFLAYLKCRVKLIY